MKAKMLTLLGFIGMTVALASCGGHTHKGEDTWQHSNDEHYHVCPDCNQKYGYAEHTLTKSTVTAATCETAGKDKYTCSVCGYSFEEDVAALGHDFTNAVRHYQWDTAHTKCDASVACTRTGCNHVVTESCTECTYEVIKDPTCEDYGEVRATATFTNALFATQSESFQSGEPIGHEMRYSTPFWIPNSSESFDVYVMAQCIHDGCTKSLKIDAIDVQHVKKSDSTCTVPGEVEYTATFPDGLEIPAAKKIVKLPLAEHVSDGVLHHDASGHWNECRVCSTHMNEADHSFENGVCECSEERVYTSIETLVKMNTVPEETKYTTIGMITGLYNYGDNCEVWLGDGEYGIEVASVKKGTGLTLEVGKYIEVVDADYVRDTSKNTITLKNAAYVGNIDFTATSHPTKVTVADPVDFPITLASWPTVIDTIENNTTLNRSATVVGVVKQVPTSFDKTKDNTFVVVDNSGATVTVFAKKNALTDAVYTALGALHMGDKVTMSGVISHYNGNTQLVALRTVTCDKQALVTVTTSEGFYPLYNNSSEIYNAVSYAVSKAPVDGSLTTVDVYADDPFADGAIIPAGANILVNLHGNKLTFAHDPVGSSGTETLGFQVLKGAKLTIKDGTLTVKEHALYSGEADGFAILIQNYGDVKLENAVVDNSTNTFHNAATTYAVSNNFGSLTIDKTSKIIGREGGQAFDMWYGMNAEYQDGIMVTFPKDLPNENIVGAIEYGRSSTAAGFHTLDWFNKTIFVQNGESTTISTVNNADQIAAGSCNSYPSFAAFKGDLKEVQAVLIGIEVDTTGAKTVYNFGDKFTTAGIKVIGHYDLGTTADVTAQATFDLADGYEFDEDDYPSKTVTATVSTFTDDYAVTVNETHLTVGEVRALEFNSPLITQGNVIAVNTKNFILGDSTGMIFVNANSTSHGKQVGDFLRIDGQLYEKNYLGQKEIKSGFTAKEGLGTDPQYMPDAITLTKDAFDNDDLLNNGLIMLEGYIKVLDNGNFHYMASLNSEESAKAAYFLNALSGMDVGKADNEGKIYSFEGVLVGLNSSSSNARVIIPNSVEQIDFDSFTISSDKNAIKSGEVAQLSTTFSPAGSERDVVYEIVDGPEDAVEISTTGEVSVKNGGTVEIKARVGEEYSSDSVKIEATLLTLDFITISGSLAQTTYGVGGTWNVTGLTVTASYSDGSTPDITNDVTWSFNPEEIDSTDITSVSITATFEGETDTKSYNVTVYPGIADFTAKTSGHSYYNDTWDYGDNFTIYGGANNNKGWTYMKFGIKSANSSNTVTTKKALKGVSKVRVITNAGTLPKGSVSEWGVNIYDDQSQLIDKVVGGAMTKATAETLDLTIDTSKVLPENAYYYEVYFNVTNSTTTNGIVWIDMIQFIK